MPEQRPLWRVKVACIDEAGDHIISNQYVHATADHVAEVMARDRLRARGAEVHQIVQVTRGRFVAVEEEDLLVVAHKRCLELEAELVTRRVEVRFYEAERTCLATNEPLPPPPVLQAQALVTYHKEAWDEGFAAARAQYESDGCTCGAAFEPCPVHNPKGAAR